MVKPFKKIDGDVLASTNAACSDKGEWTDVHAAWLRRGENSVLVRQFMDGRMADEVAKQEAERAALELVMQPVSPFRGEFWNERAKGPYRTYPTGWQPKSAVDRAAILRPHFRGLDFSHVEALVERYCVSNGSGEGEHVGGYRTPANGGRALVLPESMDSGLIVFPKLEAVVRLVKNPPAGWKPLNIAMGYLLHVLKEAFPYFCNYTEKRIGPEYEQLFAATEAALLEIGAKIPGDVLVLPAQTGALFAGYSVRSSRGHMSALQHHIPLHDFGGGCLALTDPERFSDAVLWMDCPGTERAPEADGAFSKYPYWSFGGRLLFSSGGVDDPSESYGSASFASPE
jgi:hypothetical protein